MKSREFLSAVLKNKVFWAVLILPFLVQLVFLFLLVPALNGGGDNIKNVTVGLVSDDSQAGALVVKTIGMSLPFRTETYGSRDGALSKMSAGDLSAVFYIPGSFTAEVQSGGARIEYDIDQAAPTLTKQLLETVAREVNAQVNQLAFAQKTAAMKSGLTAALSSGALPPAAVSALGDRLNAALSSLAWETVRADVVKVNASDGFIQMFIPMFVYLAFFLSAVVTAAASCAALDRLRQTYSKWAVLAAKLAALLISGCIVQFALMLITACFGIPMAFDAGRLWAFSLTGFVTFGLFMLMFCELFGLKGIPPTMLVLLPLQIVTCAVIFPKEVLPPFYAGLRVILPSSYFGSGFLKAVFGGASAAGEIGSLLLIAAAALAVIAVTTALRWRKKKEPNAVLEADA
jgi:uncharacterized phage infection (PIP) family protein YhgE